MTRDEALTLLCGGVKGIKHWNSQRTRNAALPSLENTDLHKTNLSEANLRSVVPYRPDLNGADLSSVVLNNADLSGAYLRGANLSGAKLYGADLSGADLHGADLHGADLCSAKLLIANLNEANLSRASLNWADLHGVGLSEANLSGANLSGADLSDANLSGANLSGANLSGADLSEANLSGANLRGADLSGADLSRANLSGANLSGADLTLGRLFRTDLAGAVVEGVIVQDAQPFQLRSLPTPANTLRLGSRASYTQLTGDEARNFFVLPAIVEVFLTCALGDEELALLYVHLADVRRNCVASDVYLVGHRHEAGGSVLRFQGPSYDAVYDALPDLLAAFRTTEAIDWKKTLETVPKDERGEAISVLAKAETRLKTGRWRLAERLASTFEGFADARVVKLVEGRQKGVSITVFSDKAMLDKITRATLPSGSTSASLVIQGPSTHYHGDMQMGDRFDIKGPVVGAALGRGANVTVEQIVANIGQLAEASPDADLVAAVKKALEEITKAKLPEPDQVEAAETVSKVQKEAEKPKEEADTGRPGRLKRWLDSLAAICKPAADAIAAAKAVVTALGG